MGLFDFLKTKKQVPVAKTATNADNNYVNAVFLSIHKGQPHPHNATAHLAWLSYKLGIKDPTTKHQEMFDKGYFRKATPSEILNTYRVAEIKEILNSYGVKAEGKKTVLIDTLLEQVTPEELKLPELFRLSSKGWDFIEQHEDLILLFQNPYNIKYEEYIAVKNDSPPHLKYNDIIWKIFNKWELETPFDDCFTRKHIRLYQAMFLQSEKRFVASLETYIKFLFFDLNRPEFYLMVNGKVSKDHPIDTDATAQKAIFELKNHFKPEMVDRAFDRAALPQVIVSKQDFKRAVQDVLEGKEIDIRDYLPKSVK